MREQLYRKAGNTGGFNRRKAHWYRGYLVPVEQPETIIEIVNFGPAYPTLKMRHSCPGVEEGLYRLVKVSDE